MARWNPWRTLRERTHIEFALVDLPDSFGGAFYSPQGDWAALLVDRRLPRRGKKAATGHELVHDELGAPITHRDAPASWADVVGRDERRCDRIAARRFIPRDELIAFIDSRMGCEEVGVTVWEVAEEFDITEDVAELALRMLKNDPPQGWDAV